MVRNIKLLSCFLLIQFNLAFSEQWISSDILTIEWGIEPNQLDFSPGGPVGPAGSFEEPSAGPSRAIVDIEENIIVCSFQLFQLKGFTNTGDLIFDFSIYGADFDPEMYYELPENIYVDSLLRLYVQSDPGTRYAPVIEYSGEIVDKIRPFSQNSDAYINYMNWSPNGTLFFFNREYGWVTYSDGQSQVGGSTCFLAANGSFYTVAKKSANSVEFKKFENPDSTTLAETRELTEVPIEADTLVAVGLINGGDGHSLYVVLAINDFNHSEIWQFDFEYNVIDKLILTNEESYEGMGLSPFVRNDGNIYEFLFREDGLHVIRWSKE